MNNDSSSLNALTREQHKLLLAVFSDCREFYPSRSTYDADFKHLSRVTLDDLYDGWRAINAALVNMEVIQVPCMPSLTLDPYSASVRFIRAVRQLHGLYSRLDGCCDPKDALSSYRDRVKAVRSRVPNSYIAIARDLVSAWLGAAPALSELYPKHGPGAVAEGYNPIDKARCNVIFEQFAPFGGETLFYLNDNHKRYEPRVFKVLRHPITRVIAVPKDFRKPRIIAAEPCSMQFLQQGLLRYMVSKLESSCPYVNFRDQTVNAKLAREWEQVATLDMSDASDLVSRRLVKQLFPEDWTALLFALRSHFSRMPDGTLVPLRSFAGMGSALCFPVETIVFTAISAAALLVFYGEDKRPVRQRSYLRVYGDDVIVPLEAAEYVKAVFLETGFLPNDRKCCLKGFFRESCGAEWWKGEDVTVVRPRSLNPMDSALKRSSLMQAMPMVQHAVALEQRGFTNAACYLAKLCKFPVALGKGDIYGTPTLPWPLVGKLRWNRNLQRAEQQCLLPVQVAQHSSVSTGYDYLFLGLVASWNSEQVLKPRNSPKYKWVLAAPLADR